MAKKKYYDEDGNEVKNVKIKKPFYKKWWFWLIVVILVIAFVGSGGEESTEEIAEETVEVEAEDDSTEESETIQEDEVTEGEETATLFVGDSHTIDDITFTVTGAEYTEERNEFAEEDPERVIAIHYTLENNSEEDYPFGMDVQVYVDGTQASSYPLGSDFGSVSSGRSVEGTAYYGINGEQTELEWEPMFSFSGEKGVWDVTPQ